MIVEEMVIHFLFDGRKVHQHIRTHTAEESLTLPEAEIVAPTPHDPSVKTHLMAEHSMNGLGTMVQINMKEFTIPLNQHHWCVKWCKDVYNMSLMRKLGRRSLKESLKGDTPDTSMLRFYMWETFVI